MAALAPMAAIAAMAAVAGMGAIAALVVTAAIRAVAAIRDVAAIPVVAAIPATAAICLQLLLRSASKVSKYQAPVKAGFVNLSEHQVNIATELSFPRSCR
jgi:hypothetical protein